MPVNFPGTKEAWPGVAWRGVAWRSVALARRGTAGTLLSNVQYRLECVPPNDGVVRPASSVLRSAYPFRRYRYQGGASPHVRLGLVTLGVSLGSSESSEGRSREATARTTIDFRIDFDIDIDLDFHSNRFCVLERKNLYCRINKCMIVLGLYNYCPHIANFLS